MAREASRALLPKVSVLQSVPLPVEKGRATFQRKIRCPFAVKVSLQRGARRVEISIGSKRDYKSSCATLRPSYEELIGDQAPIMYSGADLCELNAFYYSSWFNSFAF